MARIRRRNRGMRGGGDMGGGVKARSGIRGTVRSGGVKARSGMRGAMKSDGRRIGRRINNYGTTTGGCKATSDGRAKEEIDLWDKVVPDSEDSDDGVEPRRGIRGTVKPGDRRIRRCTNNDDNTTGFSPTSHGCTKKDDALQNDLIRYTEEVEHNMSLVKDLVLGTNKKCIVSRSLGLIRSALFPLKKCIVYSGRLQVLDIGGGGNRASDLVS